MRKILELVNPIKIPDINPYNFNYEGKKYIPDNDIYYLYTFTNGYDVFRVEISKNQDEAEVVLLVKKHSQWKIYDTDNDLQRIMETLLDSILTHFIDRNNWCETIIIKNIHPVYWKHLLFSPINGWAMDKFKNEIYLDKVS